MPKPKVKKTTPQVVKHTQTVKGRVVSAKTLKTVVVLVERKKVHPLYKKAYAQSQRYLVHDELNAKEGDLVEMIKIKPISKRKHWMVNKIVGVDMEAIASEKLKSVAAEAIAQVMPEKTEEEADGSTQK